jgi:long-chain acyl-CoA synthetase
MSMPLLQSYFCMNDTPPETLIAALEHSAKKYSDRPALSMNVNYRTRTLRYKDLYIQSKQMANWLASEGVQQGDTVLMNAPSSPQAVVLLFAVLMRGAIFVPLNTQSTPEMIKSIAKSCDAKLYFTHSRGREIERFKVPVYNLDLLPELIKKKSAEHTVEAVITGKTLAQIMYTSGTTGEPKGVMLTHENMLATASIVARNAEISHHDTLLSILPLSHIYEQVVGLFAPLLAGAHIVYLHRPSALVSLLREHKVTKMAGVPEFLRILMNKIELAAEQEGRGEALERLMRFNRWVPSVALRRLLARSVHKRLGGRLRVVASGGSPLDAELEQKWNALGIQLLQGYGLTEVSGVATMNTFTAHKEHSVGKPIDPVQLFIADDGEICLSGASVFSGYYKRRDATDAVIEKGVFHTGDIGEFDEDGFLYIKGRKKYMLKGGGGQNIYPEDIEFELDAQPGIADSCVVGVESGSHLLIVAVVRTEEEAVDLAVVQAATNEKLASYQRVNQILVWPESDFPRSASKKIKRDPVREWATQALAGGSANLGVEKGSRLADLLASVTGAELGQIQPEARLVTDLALDSLMRVELVSRIELEFGVLIEETAITSDTTVAELQTIIDETEPSTAKEPFVRWPVSSLAQLVRVWLVAPALNTLTRILFRTEVHGFENISGLLGPCLIMPNHVNALDSIVVARTLPDALKHRHSHAAGADVELFHKYKTFTALLRLWLNVFALPRKEDAKVVDGLAYVGWMLDQNHSVVFFPEGDTKEEDVILPLKPGAALFATQMGVPVVPVYIANTAEVMDPHGLAIVGWFKTVRIWYGKPLYFTPTDSIEEARLHISLAIGQLRDEAIAYAEREGVTKV